jgi:hypothetical protein
VPRLPSLKTSNITFALAFGRQTSPPESTLTREPMSPHSAPIGPVVVTQRAPLLDRAEGVSGKASTGTLKKCSDACFT